MGMYCKKCNYDLRGQESPRCPECGTDFDPADSKTFHNHSGRLHRAGRLFQKLRIPCAILLTCVWVMCMFIGPPRFYARRNHGGMPRTTAQNLKMITIQRVVWQLEDPTIRNFDRAMALRDLHPMPSPYTEPWKNALRPRLKWVERAMPGYAAITAIYSFLMIPLLKRRRRWVAVGVSLLSIALIAASGQLVVLSKNLALGSYAYLDDYVFIDGIQFALGEGGDNTTVAGYDIRSFEGDQKRIVVFANAQVGAIPDERARSLFESQGLEYPTNAGPGASE